MESIELGPTAALLEIELRQGGGAEHKEISSQEPLKDLSLSERFLVVSDL